MLIWIGGKLIFNSHALPNLRENGCV